MAPMTLAHDPPALDVERREQRGGPVSAVVVGSALRLPGPHREQRLRAIEGLNLGLLVDAQDQGLVRRGKTRLEEWSGRRKTAQALALRARIILESATGKTNVEVARELRIQRGTVGKWRTRCAAERLDGLLDEPRPGAPRKIADETALARRPGFEDVRFLAVKVDRDGALADKWLAQNLPGAKLTVLRDGEGSVLSRFGAAGMPALYVLDREGVVRHVEAGYETAALRQVETVLDSLVAPRP
jgi:hypothetical protein